MSSYASDVKYITVEELEERPEYFNQLWWLHCSAHHQFSDGFSDVVDEEKERIVEENPVISSYTTDVAEVEHDIQRLGKTVHNGELPPDTVYELDKSYVDTVLEGNGDDAEMTGQEKEYHVHLLTRERLKRMRYSPPPLF